MCAAVTRQELRRGIVVIARRFYGRPWLHRRDRCLLIRRVCPSDSITWRRGRKHCLALLDGLQLLAARRVCPSASITHRRKGQQDNGNALH